MRDDHYCPKTLMRAWTNEDGKIKTQFTIQHNQKRVTKFKYPTSIGFEPGGDEIRGQPELTAQLKALRDEAENNWPSVKDAIASRVFDAQTHRTALLMCYLVHGYSPFSRADSQHHRVNPTDKQVETFCRINSHFRRGRDWKTFYTDTKREISSYERDGEHIKFITVRTFVQRASNDFAGRKLIYRFAGPGESFYSGTQAAYHVYGTVFFPLTPKCCLENRNGSGKPLLADASSAYVARINKEISEVNKSLTLFFPP